ncbi:FxsC protein [Plantactinospora sp. WMMB334]|uniref:FxsC protein n=1 Tax=Plantactinospora sp. WMMB334 TaxID=3404119 RepID=UPI003B93B2C2
MTQFFLSRAAGDDDSYALRFFHDLSARVREVSGVDGDVGFVETVDGDSRSPWSTATRNALAGCQAFVALCSPRYFLSERCGRQWWIFAERLRQYERETGRRAPALLSVLWSDSGVAEGGGEAVRQLIRLRSHRARYEALLASLAGQIVASTEEHLVPPVNPNFDLATVPNAFDYTRLEPSVQTPPRKDLADAATQRVHFVVAAGSRAEMGAVRDDLRCYGERGRDWAAYRPSLPEPLVAHARMLAAERLFGSDVADLDDLSERLDQARRNNEIVVLLVDAWVTKLASYQRILAEFDGHAEPIVAVLAPSSLTDAETVRHGGELRAGLARTLPRHLARGDQLVRLEIDSPEAFETDLVAALEEAQNRIFSHGRVFRRPAQDEPADRPILQGP